MKNKKLIIPATMIIAVVLFMAFSYAYLQMTTTSEKGTDVVAGTLSLNLDEKDNGLNVAAAYPMTSEDGKASTPYTFTLENDGTIDSDYTIYLDDLDIDINDQRLENNKIRYYLTRDEEIKEEDKLSGLGISPKRVLDRGIIKAGSKQNYAIRLWIDESASHEVSGKVFKGKLRIEASQTMNKPPEDITGDSVVLNIDTTNTKQLIKEYNDETYEVLDNTILDVNTNGLITGKKLGTTEIIVRSKKGNYKKKVKVTVEKELKVEYVKQGLGVESIGKTTDTCKISEEGLSCEVELPEITSKTGYKVVGWNIDKAGTTGELPGTKAKISKDTTYYSIGKKDAITYTVNFNANGNSITDTSKSCTIPDAFNDSVQATSCSIITPAITAHENTPVVVGYNVDKTATSSTLGSNTSLNVTSSNNGSTYYAITKSNELTYSASFNANGNTIDSTLKSCTIASTYNGIKQATSCGVTTPTILPSVNTPIVVGYNTDPGASNSIVGSNSPLTLDNKNNSKTYYAITKKTAITYTVNFNANGNSITDTSKSCTIEESFNDNTQATSCSITTPVITGSANTPVVVGYNTNKTATSSTLASNASLSVTSSNNGTTYYAITKSNPKTYTATYTKQGAGVSAIGATSNACTIDSTYNGTLQASSCSVTTPTITTSSGYTAIGWNEDADATTGVTPNTSLSLNSNKTLYSVSKKNAIVRTATYTKQGTGVTAIGVASNTCTIDEVFNDEVQGTSCNVTLPSITTSTGYTVIGWNENKDATTATPVNTEVSLNTNKTYYSISKKNAISYSVNFNANGNTIAATSKSCTIPEVFNNVAQATSCNITSPIITAPTNTPVVVGYNVDKDATSSTLGSNATLSVTSSNNESTYYAITKSNPKTYTATYTKQGTGVSQVGKETDSCTINSTYNGNAQVSSCSVTTPTITVLGGHTAIGWNENKDATTGVSSNASLSLSSNKTLYSISKKNAISYSVNFNANGNAVAATSKSCIVPDAFNDSVQATSCSITSPVITAPANTPVVVGYNTNKESTISTLGSNATLSVTSSNNGTTYYAITKSNPKTYTATYTKQGVGVSAIGATSNACTIDSTYNGALQSSSCSVTTPTITALGGYTAIGWNEDADATTGVTPNTSLSLSSNKTLYSISKKNAVVRTATYTKQGTGVTAIGTTSNTCTIGEVFNDAVQGTSCNVILPSITVSGGYTVIGWNENKDATTATPVLTEVSLNTNKTYYSISKKNAISYSINFNANGNTVASTSKSCTIPEVFNSTAQATSCNITSPIITAPTNTPVIVGYNINKATTSSTLASNASLSVTSSNNGTTYYAITKKDAVVRTISYVKGSNVSTIGKTSDSCTIKETYNGVLQGTSCNVVLPSITPSTGYTSVGFNKTNGATTGVVSGSNLSLTSNETYYANATANAYTIEYYSEGVKAGTTSAKYGTSTTLTSSSTLGIKKTGYTFKGWSTADGAAVTYNDGASVSNLASSAGSIVKLYAVFKDETGPSCTFTNVGNTTTANQTTLKVSCTDTGVGMASQTLTNTNFTTSSATGTVVSVSSPSAITNGYEYTVTVKGNNVGTFTVTLNAGSIKDTLTNTNKAVTSSNVVISGRTYTATFTKNGTGVSAIGATSASCTTTGANTTCPVILPTITVSSGYTAIGWNTTNSATTGTTQSTSYTLSSNTTLYSISKKNAISYSINFNANGNTVAATSKSCTIPEVFNSTAQATSCSITSPVITAPANTPVVVGYNTNKAATTSVLNSNAALSVTASNNATTYYAITRKDAVTRTATFNRNGASTQTNAGGTAVADTTVTRSCSIGATYNGVAQSSGCSVTSPTIVASSNTPTIVGYNTSAGSTTSGWSHNTAKSISNNVTYYAVTRKDAVVRTATYTKNGTGVSAIGTTSNSCTIAAVYNGAAQGTACSVTLPTITVSSGYTAIGWNTTNTATTGSAQNTGYSLTANRTLYSISKKNAISYSVNFNANGNTIAATSKSCTIPEVFNSTAQATSCSITSPIITAPTNTPTVVGYNTNKAATASALNNNASLSVTASNKGSTYYAITRKDAVTRTATYAKGSGVSAIGTTSNACTMAATYNGVVQKPCSVTLPSITSLAGYNTGFWSTSSTAASGSAAGTSITLSGNVTYYAKAFDTTRPVWSLEKVKPSAGTTIKPNDSVMILVSGTDTSGNTIPSLTRNDIIVRAGTTVISPIVNFAPSISAIPNGYQYLVSISKFNGLGNLSITIRAGTIKDESNNSNIETSLSTGITIILPATDKLLEKSNSVGIVDYNAGNKGEMFTFKHAGGVQQVGYTEEELTDYRYIGNIPNNYVTFNNEEWRIIGVFTEENESRVKEKKIKIVRNQDIGRISLGSSNNWSDSPLKDLLNTGDYYNKVGNYTATGLTKESKEMIEKGKWWLGASPEVSYSGPAIYAYERGTTVPSGHSTSWIGEVGLMYSSDYVYTFANRVDDICYTDTIKCRPATNGSPGWHDQNIITRLLTPTMIYNNSGGTVIPSGLNGVPQLSLAGSPSNIRPVVYLKSNIQIASGDGTSSNPYKLTV